MSRMTMADCVVRSLIRGLAYRVARSTPFWVAVAILAVLFFVGLVSGV